MMKNCFVWSVAAASMILSCKSLDKPRGASQLKAIEADGTETDGSYAFCVVGKAPRAALENIEYLPDGARPKCLGNPSSNTGFPTKDWSIMDKDSILERTPSTYNKSDTLSLPIIGDANSGSGSGKPLPYRWFAVSSHGFYIVHANSLKCLRDFGGEVRFSDDECSLFQIYGHPSTASENTVPVAAELVRVLSTNTACNMNNQPFNIGELLRAGQAVFDQATMIRSLPNTSGTVKGTAEAQAEGYMVLNSACNKDADGTYSLWYEIAKGDTRGWAFWMSEPGNKIATTTACTPSPLNDAFCSKDKSKVLVCDTTAAGGPVLRVLDDCSSKTQACTWGTVNGHFARSHCE